MYLLAWQWALIWLCHRQIAAFRVGPTFKKAQQIAGARDARHLDALRQRGAGRDCRQYAAPGSIAQGGGGCCSPELVSASSVKAILLCGGIGQRMNGALEALGNTAGQDAYVPPGCPPYKQFVHIHGVPLFVYSLAEFLRSPIVSQVTVATRPEWNLTVLQQIDSKTGVLLSPRGIPGSVDATSGGPLDPARQEELEHHLLKFPYVLYDLEERRCLLSSSAAEWRDALKTTVQGRDHTRYKVVNLCTSGDHRATTVYNALLRKNALDAKLPGCCREEYIALVHDGVRPMLRHIDIAALVAAAKTHGAAVPAVGAADTIKVAAAAVTGSNGGSHHKLVESTPNRATLFAAQTPQAFSSSLLKRAYAHALGAGSSEPPAHLTDDASFVEHLGKGEVALVEGHRMNIKLTTLEDVAVCSHYLRETYFRAPPP